VSAKVASVEDLSMHFGPVRALDDATLDIAAGEVLGVVGESGSGKSTLGRCLLRLLQPTAGRVTVAGTDITHLPERALRGMRAQMTLVFQDPWAALNPRMTARRLIEEPLLLHTSLSRAERRDAAAELGAKVRLMPDQLDRAPAGLSGGQLQRVCIARAIATRPRLIVLDEPTSSLDLSVRAGILDLLAELRVQTDAAMVFITHDLGTLRLIADRIAVLYLGRIVELGPAQAILRNPFHPYTQALLSAHLSANPGERTERIRLAGEIPSPIDLPPGCAFALRCPLAQDRCHTARPALVLADEGRLAACVRIQDGSNRILP
jgi:oligopeptide/dipeptide ABC transporter ATP-binding protein